MPNMILEQQALGNSRGLWTKCGVWTRAEQLGWSAAGGQYEQDEISECCGSTRCNGGAGEYNSDNVLQRILVHFM